MPIVSFWRRWCGAKADVETTEPPRVITSPTDFQWVGGLRPCAKTPSAASLQRRRDFARGVVVEKDIYVEAIRPATTGDLYTVPIQLTPEDIDFCAVQGEAKRGEEPSEGPFVIPREYQRPESRYQVAPWEAPMRPARPDRPMSSILYPSSHPAEHDTQLHRRNMSVNLSRFSWTSSDTDDAAVELDDCPREELPSTAPGAVDISDPQAVDCCRPTVSEGVRRSRSAETPAGPKSNATRQQSSPPNFRT